MCYKLKSDQENVIVFPPYPTLALQLSVEFS